MKAQELGLNTCWVAMTYGKGKCAAKIEKGEKLVCVISLGYGQTQGVPHKNKELKQVCNQEENQPDWFVKGVKAALLAPTAMNQQKFYFNFQDNQVSVKSGTGFYTKLDLGSVKVDQAISLHEKNPLAVTGFLRGKTKKRILPVSCYLIEHPKGKIPDSGK